MQRFAILLLLTAAVSGPARAGSVDEWIQWRIQENAREMEEQIGIEFGDRAPPDLHLLHVLDDGFFDRRLVLERRRVVIPPSIRIELTVSGARQPQVALAVTLRWSGVRREQVAVPRPLPRGAPGPFLPPRITGMPALDHALWALALAEKDAMTALARCPSPPRARR